MRVWGFNDAFPAKPGSYSEMQGRGLDYVVAGAGRRGLRLIVALGNFWPGACFKHVSVARLARLAPFPVVWLAGMSPECNCIECRTRAVCKQVAHPF